MIIEAKGLKKEFCAPQKQIVLAGVDLTLHEGESLAIVGRSGEGKSTLLQILGGLDKADAGEISYRGNRCLPRVGFVFQSFHLLEDFTVLENILMPSRIARESCAQACEAYKRALELLALVGLKEHASKLAKQLSGGEKQRVAIARALQNRPEILFADEPTGNLDFETSAEIQDLLFQLTKRFSTTLVLVTHDLELAGRCDRALRLQSGELFDFCPV